MQIRRLFVNELAPELTLSRDEHHYATRVLRLKSGQMVELISPTGCAPGEIVSIDTETRIRVLGEPEMKNESALPVTLYQGMPDHVDKLELVVQKAVELGVSTIVPFLSRYTDSKYQKMDLKRKMDRIRKIGREAVRQCRRSVVPDILDPQSLHELKHRLMEHDLTFVFYERPVREKPLTPPDPRNTGILIGPEGGFADHEVDQLLSWNIIPVHLPGPTLRTETAALAAITLIMSRYGTYRNMP